MSDISLVDANSPTMLPHHTLVDCHTTERSQEGWMVDRRPGVDGIVTFDKVAIIQTPAHVSTLNRTLTVKCKYANQCCRRGSQGSVTVLLLEVGTKTRREG